MLTDDGVLSALSVALSQLGYPGVYHMRDVVANPDHALHWRKAFVAKFEEGKPWGREEWDQLLGDSAVRFLSCFLRSSIKLCSW